METEQNCQAQTYWYDAGGKQRAKFCDKPATMLTRALDGSRSHGCDEHGARMIASGAILVTDH